MAGLGRVGWRIGCFGLFQGKGVCLAVTGIEQMGSDPVVPNRDSFF